MTQPSVPGNPNLEAVAVTHMGHVRKNNEDSYGTYQVVHPRLGLLHLWIVADGMGGGAKGEVASQLAVEAASTYLKNARWDQPGEALKQAIEHANREVYREGSGAGAAPRSAMGTTITAALVSDRDGFYWIANVGDSRAYLQKKDGPVTQLTRDHSLVRERVEAGIITESEARHAKDANVVTRALGLDPSVTVDVVEGVEPLAYGDRLLLASDGMHGMVGPRGISRVALRAHKHIDLADNLVKAALRAGGKDNVTVLAGGYADGSTMPVDNSPTVLDPGVPGKKGRARQTNWAAMAAVLGAVLVLSAVAYAVSRFLESDEDGLPDSLKPGSEGSVSGSATPRSSSVPGTPTPVGSPPRGIPSASPTAAPTPPPSPPCPKDRSSAIALEKCVILAGYTCSELGDAVEFIVNDDLQTSKQAMSIVILRENPTKFNTTLRDAGDPTDTSALPCFSTVLWQPNIEIMVPKAKDIQAEFLDLCSARKALDMNVCPDPGADGSPTTGPGGAGSSESRWRWPFKLPFDLVIQMVSQP